MGEGESVITTPLYRTVVSDPPWMFRDGLTMSAVKRGAASNYDTMTLDQIGDLGRPGTLAGHAIAADAHLYLWCTNAFVEQAHQVARLWGFRPVTLLTWVKPQIGMGAYFRNNTEQVIFAVRGSLRLKVRNQPTAFEAPRRRHSEKPDEFFEIVERCSPGPFLELFARKPRERWTVWGREVAA